MAQNKKPPLLIYIGANHYDLEDPLAGKIIYVESESVEAFESLSGSRKPQPLFNPETDRLSKFYRNSYFLIDTTSPWLDDAEVMLKLPANLIILADDVLEAVSPEIRHILEMKGAYEFDLGNLPKFVQDLRDYFFVGNTGLGLPFETFVISPNFRGKIRRFGEVYHELSGFFGEKWTFLAYNSQTIWVPAGYSNSFFVEYEELEGAELKVQLKLKDPNTDEILGIQESSGEELRTKVFNIESNEAGYLAQVTYFARGSGTLHLGEIHLHRSRGPYGDLSHNGQKLISKTGMNSSIEVYFDAGDMKPPLNVYFSGWRTKESFEGNFMMQSFGSPFILISDNRLEGGAFYIDNGSLEEQVVDFIRSKLDALGFDDQDLILGGLSMGTYAALYYSAFFKPYAVIVGKPLVNLGTIAENGRIHRPQEFGTASDMILLHAGAVDETATNRVNQYFWNRFMKADFKKTTFAIAYMYQDDYDRGAFPELQAYLGEEYPTARVLSKGLTGRHNDDTGGIVDWFLLQYKYLIRDGFNRGGAQ